MPVVQRPAHGRDALLARVAAATSDLLGDSYRLTIYSPPVVEIEGRCAPALRLLRRPDHAIGGRSHTLDHRLFALFTNDDTFSESVLARTDHSIPRYYLANLEAMPRPMCLTPKLSCPPPAGLTRSVNENWRHTAVADRGACVRPIASSCRSAALATGKSVDKRAPLNSVSTLR